MCIVENSSIVLLKIKKSRQDWRVREGLKNKNIWSKQVKKNLKKLYYPFICYFFFFLLTNSPYFIPNFASSIV